MLTDFQTFFTNTFTSKYATLTIQPHLTCVAELPCEYRKIRKFDACIVINNKSQGSV